jgi:two-component system, LytTR family, sensor kinase
MIILPQYTRRDLSILAIMMPLVVVFINSLLFGERYFTEGKVFIGSSLIVLIIMTIVWFLFTWIAVTVRTRLPGDMELIRRLGITIALIGTIQALVITLFFKGYDFLHLFGYEINKPRFYWTLTISFILNILITLVHEGFESFERWRATFTETEQLKKAYSQSRLMGLKSQVNPHFLFNSLNSLSSLISENEEEAETFLDELTKVYRYLLRGPEDKLVKLETELQFIRSYFFLLKARYGQSVSYDTTVLEEYYPHLIPPLTLLTLFENAFNQNATHKDSPLKIKVAVAESGWLEFSHNVQKKIAAINTDESGIENLSEKIRLLTHQQIAIEETEKHRVIRLPLIHFKTMEA